MVTPVFWSKLWQRHQSFALELAKLGYTIFYLQPLKSGGLSIEVVKKSINGLDINIITCNVPFKATSQPSLNNISAKFALFLLKKKLNINFSESVLWLSEPSLSYFTKCKWAKIIYDKCDLHGTFPGQKKWIWNRYENEIFNHCNLCLCSHEYILNDIPEYINALVVKNAVTEDFKPIKPKQRKKDKVLKLVSCGAHYEWIDFNWLFSFLKQDNTELHIVGTGRGKDFEQLLKTENVIFHGQIEHNELPDLLQDFDVGLVPFKDIELIKGVDPIKIYEYASLGLKIWAPDIKCLYSNTLIDDFVKFEGCNRIIISNKNKKNSFIPTWKNRIFTLKDLIMVNKKYD